MTGFFSSIFFSPRRLFPSLIFFFVLVLDRTIDWVGAQWSWSRADLGLVSTLGSDDTEQSYQIKQR